MMESSHTPTHPAADIGMLETEMTDDSLGATMASANLDDLALDGGDGGNDAAAVNEAEADPWAVLAAAAGEEAPSQSPSAIHAETAVPATAVPTAKLADNRPAEILSHAQGETFSLSDLNNDDQRHRPPSLASQLQSSTANLTSTLSSKITEINAKTGLTTKAKQVDTQYHLTEKWTNFSQDVLKPTTARTVEKTKEVSSSVKEKVMTGPAGASVKEHWGSIKARSTEMGITQKWAGISNRLAETSQKCGESVEHWKVEQEKKRALANSVGGDDAARLALREQQHQQFQQNVQDSKKKVVESWSGGVSWVSQRIAAAKLSGELNNGNGGAMGDNGETKRTDSDGLPSSFHRDE